jgi:hypothetical protein
MTANPAMRYCPDCRAPNPAGRAFCHVCGQSLGRRPDGMPGPGEGSSPCPNCGAAVALSATACPECGRIIPPPSVLPAHLVDVSSPRLPEAFGQLNLSPPPPDWRAEPLPDGTIRLRRTTWGRINTDASMLLIFVFVPLLFFNALFGRRGLVTHHVGNPWEWYFPLGLVAAVGIAGVIWVLFAREVLRTGPGLLEVRKSLFGYEWARRIEGVAVLRLRTNGYYTRNGRQRRRVLIAENLGLHITVDSRTRSDGLFGLFSDTAPDDVGRLGLFLSEQTGWPLIDPEHGRY